LGQVLFVHAGQRLRGGDSHPGVVQRPAIRAALDDHPHQFPRQDLQRRRGEIPEVGSVVFNVSVRGRDSGFQISDLFVIWIL
jgi:hypothetical protein